MDNCTRGVDIVRGMKNVHPGWTFSCFVFLWCLTPQVLKCTMFLQCEDVQYNEDGGEDGQGDEVDADVA